MNDQPKLCQSCGKPPASGRAGSITGYFFQHNFCQCNNNVKDAPNRNDQSALTENNQICLKCGKSRPRDRKEGSFTAFLFKELRCHCTSPKFAESHRGKNSHSTTSTRNTIKRKLAHNIREQLENSGSAETIGIGTVIGGTFKIQSIIGEGGMGVVYLTEHLALRRNFALKILPPNLMSDTYWLRFQSEAKTLAALKHPNLVNVYDLGIHQNSIFYYSMDYLQGENLEDRLVREGPLSAERTIDIFLQVLDGLAYAHRNGIVHRDIKPANIFLCAKGSDAEEVKILDFGISKVTHDNQQLTAAGEIFGSPYYMSPEQCMGSTVDLRADIYSVGCSIFEALTGCVPFEGKSSVDIGLMHQEKEPPRLFQVSDLDLPSFEQIIAKCLAKLPRERYQSAKELALDLERGRDNKAVMAPPIGTNEDLYDDKNEGFNFPVVLIGLFVVLMSSASAGIYWFSLNSAPAPSASKIHTPYTQERSGVLKDLGNKSLSILSTKLDEPETAEISKFLGSHPQNYATKLHPEDKLSKIFYFPKTFSLGTINGIQATGHVNLSANQDLNLYANANVSGHPQLLSYFAPDDLKHLELPTVEPNSDTIMPYVARLKSLITLEMTDTEFTADSVKYLDELELLRSLKIDPLQSAIVPLAESQTIKRIQAISLRHVGNVTPILDKLSNNHDLIVLGLGYMKLPKADIATISTWKNLRNLNFRSVPLDNDDLRQLSALKNLTHLTIRTAANLDRACLIELKRFKNLTELILPPELLNESDVKELEKALPNLKSIHS